MKKASAIAARTEIRKKGQVTIPASVRKAARLEDGDLVELEVTAEGILIRRLETIDARQAWFWTEAWQAGERQASKDLASKRTTRHESSQAFLESLDE